MDAHIYISATEENYLKAIFQLSERSEETISTNAIAAIMNTSAASVTDMLKRLTDKGYTIYEKYKGVLLSDLGKKTAIQLLRKHRLWETFMVDKLDFTWDEVHPIAEQLEHIQSDELIDRLDAYLGHPRFDPHGDPIPDKNGNIEYRRQVLVSDLAIGEKAVIVGVNEHSPMFLKYVEQLQLTIGKHFEIVERFDFDASIRLRLDNMMEQIVTHKVCQNLFAAPLS